MTATAPVVLVFEDLQWADSALLEFIDYLMEWSRHHPLFVLTLSRPEVAEDRPALSFAARGMTALALEPLTEEEMAELVGGLVAGSARGSGGTRRRCRRGRAAVRGGDGAHAARPRLPGAGGRPAGRNRRPGDARDPRDAARARRRPPRRPARPGATPDRGRGGARQDVHRRTVWRRSRVSASRSWSRSWARSSGGRCSPCRPIRCHRSAASTRSCRRSCGRSPTRRSAAASGSGGTWPRPGTWSRSEARSWPRWSRRTTSTPTGWRRTTTMPPRSASRRMRTLVRAAERAASLAAPGEAERLIGAAIDLTEDDRDRAALLERAGIFALTDGQPATADGRLTEAAAAVRAAGRSPCRGADQRAPGGGALPRRPGGRGDRADGAGVHRVARTGAGRRPGGAGRPVRPDARVRQPDGGSA